MFIILFILTPISLCYTHKYLSLQNVLFFVLEIFSLRHLGSIKYFIQKLVTFYNLTSIRITSCKEVSSLY